MKNFIQVSSLFLLLALFIVSCSKDSIHAEAQDAVEQNSSSASATEEKEPYSHEAAQSLLEEIEITDGYLVFKDREHFINTKKFFLDNEENDLLVWLNNNGVTTIESAFYNMMNEIYDDISEEEENEVYQKYQPFVQINEDGTFERKFFTMDRWYVNTEGFLKVGNRLMHYNPSRKLIALDGSKDALLTHFNLEAGETANSGNVLCYERFVNKEQDEDARIIDKNYCNAQTGSFLVKGSYWREYDSATTGTNIKTYEWEIFAELAHYKWVRGQWRKRNGHMKMNNAYNIFVLLQKAGQDDDQLANYNSTGSLSCDNEKYMCYHIGKDNTSRSKNDINDWQYTVFTNNYSGTYFNMQSNCSTVINQCSINL